jgi:iron complex outermembrane receptor protein
VAGNWRSDPGSSVASSVRGETATTSLWAQDTWAFAPRWKTVLGVRAESWQANDGLTQFSATSSTAFPSRSEHAVSPKAAVSYQWAPDTVVKAALGRAVRFPTVSELYGATSTTNSQYINDPNLKPERSWTGELTVEKSFANALLRVTAFGESTHDALYSQTVFDAAANRNISRVQNVGRIDTKGLEVALSAADVVTKGLDINGSVTFADSIIKSNDGFVATPGDTVGKWQPNIPKWRATLVATYRFTPQWSGTIGARYSGTQYRTLNNSDVNGYTYQGVSPYFTVDVRAVWKIDKTWTAAFGIDNANNYQYWNFHPYPQRSFYANLRADL